MEEAKLEISNAQKDAEIVLQGYILSVCFSPWEDNLFSFDSSWVKLFVGQIGDDSSLALMSDRNWILFQLKGAYYYYTRKCGILVLMLSFINEVLIQLLWI